MKSEVKLLKPCKIGGEGIFDSVGVSFDFGNRVITATPRKTLPRKGILDSVRVTLNSVVKTLGGY